MVISPLRYPGGKAKLYPFFSELITKNNLYSSTYYEPYAGGAGLAIKLLTSGFVKRIFINDIDRSVYAFWISALHHTEEFCARIDETPITVDEWYRQREVWKRGDVGDCLALGFSTYFLNRTNRSGIIEGAGPIGGYAQTGKWKIDARFVKHTQIENLRCLSKFAPQIEISNMDAFAFLGLCLDKSDSLLYLDPPYLKKGKKLYKNFYQMKEHIQIARELEKHRCARWVVSYDNVKEIRDIYAQFSPITYNLNYSAGTKMVGTEVIFVSDSIIPPEIHGFEVAA